MVSTRRRLGWCPGRRICMMGASCTAAGLSVTREYEDVGENH
jgi:hypothetical protein